MSSVPRARALALSACVCWFAASPASADHPVAGSSYSPKVAEASDEGRQAIARFKVPAGLKVELFAAEPLLANPVAFAFDEQNRVYVAETFRHSHGVTDTRGHMNWLDADLASRSVADRVAMYRKYLGEEEFAKYGVEQDRVRLVEDRDGDGKADHATVFADGFREPAVGIGAGVLARGGDVYYTCIPDLWLLRDEDGDGKADVRTSLQNGYGVHVGFLGHDLHGLRMGPDGRLYFSIGDRGTNVKTADRSVFLPDTGAVLRCNPDGSGLEVFASGLRNPQELAFDEHGDLFTVDNNSDGGDRARLVHVVEGGDSGWRIGYQFIESPNSRGPWNAEKLWHVQAENTGAYLLPPLANITAGPSGLTYDPGSILLPEKYRRHFFIVDFRGSADSGVHAFSVRPKGASFELADQEKFLWGLEATDVEFGNDGGLYVSDWVEGWNITGKGRIYRVSDPSKADDARAAEVKRLLAEGMGGRSVDELFRLLGHPDMRVRQEAQFALAARGGAVVQRLIETASGIGGTGGTQVDPLARLHAVWALGQLSRSGAHPGVEKLLVAIAGADDAEVRAQVAKVLADAPEGAAFGPVAARQLASLFRDESPRVRFFAALLLAKRPELAPSAVATDMLRQDGDRDPYMRHAAVMALAGIESKNPGTLAKVAEDPSAAVRLGALLAWRRLGSPEAARFLNDVDGRLVLEAARAINDVPIEAARPALAALPVKSEYDESLIRRVLNANFRGGGAEEAARLAALAGRSDLPVKVRVEAFEALGDWEKPSGRDRVMGLWRPLPGRPGSVARGAAKPAVLAALKDGPDTIRRASASLAGRLRIGEAGPLLASLSADKEATNQTRIAALKSLAEVDAARAKDAVAAARLDKDAKVRSEALTLLARLDPEAAAGALGAVLERGTTGEKQAAFRALGDLKRPEAVRLLARWLDELIAGRVAEELRLDLIEAASGRGSSDLKDRLARYEASKPKDDPLAPYREAMAGGDRDRGRRIFREKAEAQCLRCHKIHGNGGEVGPELTGIGAKKDRAYLLESIVTPNQQIAEGFETAVLATAEGQLLTGIIKGEDDDSVKLMTPEGKLLTVPKADIEGRKRGTSAMPDDTIKHLSRSELRDLIEFLARSK